jgi:hypothetical protein
MVEVIYREVIPWLAGACERECSERREYMIPAIGLMIGLYILARYCEMSRNAGIGTRVVLAIFSIVTVLCIGSLLIASVAVDSLWK